jgi:hypothetical protein
MGAVRLVRAGSAEFFVELAEGGGPQTVGVTDALDLAGVRETVEAVADELTRAWEKARPSEATVEFGLNLTAKTGRLTGLLVEGGGSASLKVSLTWREAADPA